MVVVDWTDASNVAKSDVSISYLTSAPNEMGDAIRASRVIGQHPAWTKTGRIEAHGRRHASEEVSVLGADTSIARRRLALDVDTFL